ncbi:hypothetical protein L798_03861 [Zootermopsis nevadensis]|uniref:Uncharacterized protein n=1 Tax=Zootermopsis nevadensis TaxID=136037 RepID=A0A067RMJ7_ZOONE|nr:hypothetical protein L798_03861 [Zootermopsis nevadensis]
MEGVVLICKFSSESLLSDSIGSGFTRVTFDTQLTPSALSVACCSTFVRTEEPSVVRTVPVIQVVKLNLLEVSIFWNFRT